MNLRRELTLGAEHILAKCPQTLYPDVWKACFRQATVGVALRVLGASLPFNLHSAPSVKAPDTPAQKQWDLSTGLQERSCLSYMGYQEAPDAPLSSRGASGVCGNEPCSASEAATQFHLASAMQRLRISWRGSPQLMKIRWLLWLSKPRCYLSFAAALCLVRARAVRGLVCFFSRILLRGCRLQLKLALVIPMI